MNENIRPIEPASCWKLGYAGIFEGVSNADYHAAPGLSSSTLKTLAQSPAHVAIPRGAVSASSQLAMDIGTISHAIVLEGVGDGSDCPRFEGVPHDDLNRAGFEPSPSASLLESIATYARLVQKPDGMNLATVAGKAWKAEQEAAGCTILTNRIDAALEHWRTALATTGLREATSDMAKTARAVADAVKADPYSSAICRAGKHIYTELSLRWICPRTGQVLKARLDWVDFSTGQVRDLKTCQDATPQAFARDADARDYLLQAAHYWQVAEKLGVEIREFVFDAVATRAPFECSAHTFDADHPHFLRAHQRAAELQALHAKCVSTGEWPKRVYEPGPLSVPAFSSKWQ